MQQLHVVLASRMAELAGSCSAPEDYSSLQAVLAHPKSRQNLRQFMLKEHNDENLWFLDFCHVLFHSESLPDQLDLLDQIYEMYIDTSAPGLINIGHQARQDLLAARQPLNLDAAMRALRAACTEVEAMVTRDMFPRFQAHMAAATSKPTLFSRLTSPRRTSVSFQSQAADAAFLPSPSCSPLGAGMSRRLGALPKPARAAMRFLDVVERELTSKGLQVRHLGRQVSPLTEQAADEEVMLLSRFLGTVREVSDPAAASDVRATGESPQADALLSSAALRRRFLNTL